MPGRRPQRSVRHPYPPEARGTAIPANVRPDAAAATLVLRAVMVAFAAVVYATAGFKALQSRSALTEEGDTK
jgi:hypothetical protein